MARHRRHERAKHPGAKPSAAGAAPGPAGAKGAGGRPGPGTAPRAPAPPLRRDPWAWASALAVLVTLARAWGAPLGEAVAEDFDFITHALFSPTHTLLDGGGSSAFWRPVAHQLYYESLWRVILDHPGWIAALHVTLLALASLLLYRAFRGACSGFAAFVIATFPLFSESTRTLLSWPSHFVDLGVWLFTAIALHETAARRLWSALLALLAALLCKEVALVAAVLLPWLPGIGPRDRRERLRWALAMGALAAVWAVAYIAIRQHAHLALPHQLESRADIAATPIYKRLGWAVGNSLRALFSLPALWVDRATPILTGGIALIAIAGLVAFLRARRRRAVRAPLELAAWGAAWFLLASATLASIYPIWAPNRSGYGALGFGALAAGLAEAAHPVLLAALVGLRLVAFALAPGPPAEIMNRAPDQGAFMDFERLVRLQRLMRAMRTTLKHQYPTLPHGAQIGQHYLPRMAEYAFGGAKAIQAWYRDSTLRWVRYADFDAHREIPLVAIAQFQSFHHPEVALVNTDAMRCFLIAYKGIQEQRYAESLEFLARADSLQSDSNAVVFRGEIAGERAICFAVLHRTSEAEYWGIRGSELWHENIYGNFALGLIEYERGNLTRAAALLDSVLRLTPNFDAARKLRQDVAREAAARRRLESPPR